MNLHEKMSSCKNLLLILYITPLCKLMPDMFLGHCGQLLATTVLEIEIAH